MTFIITVIIGLFIMFLPCYGKTLIVGKGEDNKTADLQEAIRKSADGDSILVKPGTYYGNYDFFGRNIVLKSIAGADSTILDGMGKNSVVVFLNGEDSTAVLEGFTIRNGIGYKEHDYRNGGGIYCSGMTSGKSASPIIQYNKIIDNRAGEWKNNSYSVGGGILVGYLSSAKVRYNIIKDNVSNDGGGIGLFASSVNIYNNTIFDNECRVDNKPGNGSGIAWYSSTGSIINNIVAGIHPYQGMYAASGSSQIECNDVWNNQGGNYGGLFSPGPGDISRNPCFADSSFNLKYSSPCIDAGKNIGFPYKGKSPDMGAVEFPLNFNIFPLQYRFKNITVLQYRFKDAEKCKIPVKSKNEKGIKN